MCHENNVAQNNQNVSKTATIIMKRNEKIGR